MVSLGNACEYWAHVAVASDINLRTHNMYVHTILWETRIMKVGAVSGKF